MVRDFIFTLGTKWVFLPVDKSVPHLGSAPNFHSYLVPKQITSLAKDGIQMIEISRYHAPSMVSLFWLLTKIYEHISLLTCNIMLGVSSGYGSGNSRGITKSQ
jgi:hypothetical protein